MATERIVTLTLNPSVDIASDADGVRPVRKVRTRDETFDPGGGGVNVSRVLRELGADTLAVVAAGGVSGRLLEELLGEAGLPHESIPTAGRTRVSYTVHDLGAKQEYRFVPEGPVLAEHEWQAALDALDRSEGVWIVASGSLPRGVPEEFFAQAATDGRPPRPAFRARHLRRAAARRAGQGPGAHQAEPGRVRSPDGREARHARGAGRSGAAPGARTGPRSWSR